MIEGIVSGADVVMGRRRSLVVRLQDGTGVLSLRFYHFSNAQKEGLKRGTRIALLRRSTARRLGAGDLSPGIPRHHRRRAAARWMRP